MIKIKKLNILDGLELKEATFKNRNFPTHFHDTYSIGIINNGIENLVIKEKSLIATSNTVVIINQNELHSNSFYNNENWTYQTINLNNDALNYLNKKNQVSSKPLTFQNLIQDDFLYHLISNFHQNPQFNSLEQINQISKYLLEYYLVENENDTTNYPKWINLIDEVKGLMNLNYNEKFNIEIIAKKYNKSSFQFIRAFKTHTGLTPIAYLTLIRLNKSKQLLANGNTLVDTALECGFFDQSHFSNYFKKYFGVSPKQYCENYSNL